MFLWQTQRKAESGWVNLTSYQPLLGYLIPHALELYTAEMYLYNNFFERVNTARSKTDLSDPEIEPLLSARVEVEREVMIRNCTLPTALEMEPHQRA